MERVSMEAVTRLVRDLAVLATVAFLGFWCAWSFASGKPADAAGVSENADMIAVTGEFGSGTSVLYLIDTRGKTLLVYESRGGSQQDLKLVAARDISYDLKLRSYNDKSDSGMSVDDLERRWRKFSGRRGPIKPAENQAKPAKNQAQGAPDSATDAPGKVGSSDKVGPAEEAGSRKMDDESKRPAPGKGPAESKKAPAPSR